MAIKTEYRMYFESEDGSAESSLEIAGAGGSDSGAIFLSQPDQAGETAWMIRMTRREALELKAILGVLTETASQEEEVTVGAVT